ncbi:ABC transporter substrate-binding protein [Halocatena halophila]|uniref:ABC transporter substrate-binding protein n=1 Tax=Halocatena halophila TaxID=2814576 RepID=UPI002ED20899
MGTDTSSDGSSPDLTVSRRKFLTALGVGGTVGLAGCSMVDTPFGAGGRAGLDEAMSISIPPTDINWNPFATEGFSENLANWVFEWGAVLFHENARLEPWAYADWEYDSASNVLAVTFREDLAQWTGDAYTARDRYTYQELVRLQSPESSQFERIELRDPTTIAYHFKDPTNPDIFTNYEFVRPLYQGRTRWQPWLERYQDATTDTERDAITKELTELSISNEEFMDAATGTGAYRLTEVSDVSATLQRWDGHRNADSIGIDTLRVQFAPSQARFGQLLTQDRADIGRGIFPVEYRGAAPTHLETLSEHPTLNNVKLLINWNNRPALRDVNVRRAMAATINTEPIAAAAGNGEPIPVHSGMDPSFNQTYLGPQRQQYIDYKPRAADHELAERFLERSGYSRQHGTVVRPDGNELQPLRFVTDTDDQWFIAGKFVAAQLEQFGFPVEFRTVDRSTKLDIIYEHQRMDEWDLSTESHYAGSTLHPFSYFDYRTFWGWRLGPATFTADATLNATIEEWLDGGETHSPYNGKPLRPEIPTTVGRLDRDGSTTTINIYELINEIRSPVSEERATDIVRQLSWAWNFLLPDIDTYVVLGGMWGDTNQYDWPQQSWQFTGANNASVYYTVKHGLVSPVEE